MNIISSILDRCFDARTATYELPWREVRARFDALVLDHIKKSAEETKNRYRLTFWSSRETGRSVQYQGIFWETQYGFVLSAEIGVWQNIPIAAIGFEERSGHFLVRQLQGVKGMKEYLRPLHWERLLYNTLIVFGRELKLDEIRVIPAHRSSYHPFQNPEASEELTFNERKARALRFHLLYNVSPRKCGFKWSERTQTHIFSLSS